jgi:hypothetical protein
VARWRRSGLSAREFAERYGVNRHTLTYWGWRLGTDAGRSPAASPTGRFIEVVGALGGPVQEPTPLQAAADRQGASVELLLRDGLVLRVELPTDAKAAGKLAAFVAALEAR